MDMKSPKLLALPPLVASLMVFAGGFDLSAATLCVKPGGSPSCFASIQDAIDAAVAGDTIKVAAGMYTEQVIVDKKLILKGAGAVSTIIQAPGALDLETDGDGKSILEITGESTKATITRFTVQGPLGGITSAIHVHGGAKAKIMNNIVEGTDALTGTLTGHGVTVGSSLDGDEDDPATATIAGNEITGFHRAGIAVIGVGSKATIENNLVVGGGPTDLTTQQGITIQDGAFGRIRGNTVQDLEFTGAASSTAVGIFLWDSADRIRIADNTLEDTETGVLVQAAVGIGITGNQITDSPGGAVVNRGIWLLGRGSGGLGCVGGDGVTPGKGCATAARIINNAITGNGEGSGVVIGKPPEVAFTPAPSTGKLRDNDISGWETSVEVLPTGSLK